MAGMAVSLALIVFPFVSSPWRMDDERLLTLVVVFGIAGFLISVRALVVANTKRARAGDRPNGVEDDRA
jgi:hypothetical protein